jgi:ABC-2 type transport system permease protein
VFTSIFSNISVIEDRHEGFLQSVLVSPLSPLSIVMGKVVGGALIALFQGLFFLALAPLAGFHFSLSDLLLVTLSISSISLAMTALGFLFAWRLDSVQGFHAVMNLVLFPMWLLSGAFFPAESASKFIKPVMYLNPLTYGMWSLRGAMSGQLQASEILIQVAVVCFFGLVFLGGAVLLVNKKRELAA